MTSSDRYTIDILDVAMETIEWMADEKIQNHKASDLARRLDINRGRMFRILKTLESRDWVVFDTQTQSYRLGWRLLSIANRIREHLDVRNEAVETIKQLAIKTGDTAHLAVLYGQYSVTIEQFSGAFIMQVKDFTGVPIPLNVGGAPKVLLAHLPAGEQERIIESMEMTRFTANTITDKDQLRKTLEEIRRQGYSLDNQDYEDGVYAIGAPVLDHSRQVVAAISVSIPESRFSPERKKEIIPLVVQAAREVSIRLGYRPDKG